MSTPIEYFYSTHSAYAYLGSAMFRSIARNAGRQIRHMPFDLRKLFDVYGHQATGSLTDVRRDYFFGREIVRWSQYRDAPVVGALPTYHHHALTLSSGMVIAAELDGQDAGELTHALLTAHWRDDADLQDTDTMRRVAATAGYQAERLLSRAMDDDVQQVFEDNTQEAISRHVFGSPTYVVDGDPFYGQDRLELVSRALEQPFA